MKPSNRLVLLLALFVSLLASACSGVSGGGDNRAGASRSGVEVFGTIDSGVSRVDQKR